MKTGDIIIKSATLGCAVAILIVLLLLLRHGSLLHREPNLCVLVAEILGVAVIVVFALLNLIGDILRRGHKE